MAITYPLSHPSSPGIKTVRFSPRSVVAISESPFTFGQQVQKFDGQKWECDVTLPPMARAVAEEWVAFLLKLNGKEGSFLFGDPAGTTPRGTATGTPVVNGGSQTGNALITDGWTNSIVALKAGDWIQLGSGTSTQLYKNLSDVSSDGSGNATFDIWPSLRSSPADGATLTVTGAKGLFRLGSNEMTWSINEIKNYGLVIAATEIV
jgi:hypothetical protein